VQNENSKLLLAKIKINQVEIGGDTRFDRVYDLAQHAKPNNIIELFANNSKVIIAGSTWEKDEILIAEFVDNSTGNEKWIIAPHEIHKSHIDKIISLFKQPILKLSEANNSNIQNTRIILVDSIGILSSLYQYGIMAYIGGGFGVGIHNTLEAATFGLPIIFGPNYKRFQEACDLIDISSGFSISNFGELKAIFNTLLSDDDYRKKTGKKASDYVNNMRGGTEKILSQLNL
jgi:3-deoxy-D-manno-octulosonic-acid transferase